MKPWSRSGGTVHAAGVGRRCGLLRRGRRRVRAARKREDEKGAEDGGQDPRRRPLSRDGRHRPPPETVRPLPSSGSSTRSSTMPRARVCAVSPIRSRIARPLGVAEELLRDAVQPERRGHAGVVEGLQQHRAAAADLAVVLDADDQPVLARQLDDRGVDRLDPARVDDGDADALGDQPLGDVDGDRGHRRRPRRAARPWCRCGRARRRRRPCRPPAMSSGGGPLGKRTTVGASSTSTASRSSSRSRAASRGAASRRPGTTCRIDMSHMPLWLAPSSPVTPARSSTKVTPHLCSATSISTWSKARLRNVA